MHLALLKNVWTESYVAYKEKEKYERAAFIAQRNEAYINSLLRSYRKKNKQTKQNKTNKINKKRQQQQKHKQGIAHRASDSRIESTFFLTPDSSNQVTHGTWGCEGWGGGVNDSCAKRRRTARQIEELMATEKTLRSGPQNYWKKWPLLEQTDVVLL